MHILISGGTGFIGSAIARKILAQGKHQLSILSRNKEKAEKLFPNQKVGVIEADLTDPESLSTKNLFTNIECVVQAAQFPNFPVENRSRGYTFMAVDGEGTSNLVDAIKKTAQVKRIIYISGAGTAPGKTEPWFQAKNKAETAVKGYKREWVILRPSWVYGPGDKSMSKFINFAKFLPVMPVIGDGKYRCNPIFIDDVADFVLHAIESKDAHGKTYDLGGPQTLTMNDIENTVLKVLNKERLLLHQPKALVKAVGFAATAFLRTPPLSPKAVDFVTMDGPVDPSQAIEQLHVQPKDLETGLRSYIGN